MPVVLWRALCFGSDSIAGSRHALRILTVVNTLRLRAATASSSIGSPPPASPRSLAFRLRDPYIPLWARVRLGPSPALTSATIIASPPSMTIIHTRSCSLVDRADSEDILS